MSLAGGKVNAEAFESLEQRTPAGVMGPKARGLAQVGEAGALRPGSVSERWRCQTELESPCAEWAGP